MYIPVQQHQSTRSRELTEALRGTIANFEARNPKLSKDEVRLALQAVTPGGATSPAKRVALVSTGIFVAVLFAVVASTAEGRNQGRPTPWVVIAAILIPAAIALVMLWVRARDD